MYQYRSHKSAAGRLFRLLGLLIALQLMGFLLYHLPVRAQNNPTRPTTSASWIWAADRAPLPEKVYFRQGFRLRDLPQLATLQVGSRGRYTLYVNGGLIMRGNGGPQEDTVYITRYVRRDINLLAFDCDNTVGQGGLRFTLTIRYRDGRTATVVSNGDERITRRQIPGWEQTALDDHTWSVAQIVREGGTGVKAPTAPTTNVTTLPPPGQPNMPASPSVNYDYARPPVRVWDITAGGQPGANAYTRPRETGNRMLLAAPLGAATDFPLLASAGFTLLETLRGGLAASDTIGDRLDLRKLDNDLLLARAYGFDWGYSPLFTPPADGLPSRFTPIQRLEDQQTAEHISPWDRQFERAVQDGYRQLAKRYGGKNGATAFHLGIYGENGDAGFFGGGRIPRGWWCDDTLAHADFREKLMRKYGSLTALNEAWGTEFHGRSDLRYPAAPTEGARRYWLDFAHWYLSSATDLADIVADAARRDLPDKLLTIPIGMPDENPRNGSDNSLLVKTAASQRADVRARYGGVQPFGQNQAGLFGRVASAARFYGAPFWSEAAGRTTPQQQVSRFFEAVSAGAKGFVDVPDNVREHRDLYYRYGKYLRVERPIVDVAMFFPTSSHLLRADSKTDSDYPPIFAKGCADIRDVLNYDIVDERMIRDGVLDKMRVLVMWEGSVVETEVLSKIRDWVQAGGVVVAYDFGKIESVEGDRAWFSDVFGYAGRLKPAAPVTRFLSEGALPARYRISVGEASANPFLAGRWLPPDTGRGETRRRVGAGAELHLPVNPKERYTLLLRASFSGDAARGTTDVLLNGIRLGTLDTPDTTTYSFPIPPAVLGSSDVATLSFRTEGGPETAVYFAQIEPTGGVSPAAAPGSPAGHFEAGLDLARLRSDWARPYGRGWTVYFPATRAQLSSYYEVVRYLTYHLSELDNTKRDAIAVDDAWDGVYATLLSDKILFYNPGAKAMTRTINLLPAAFTARRDVKTPASFTGKVNLDPNTLGVFTFEASPPEMLFQCEGFTGLGALKPQAGASYNPGQGATHVLIPPGGQITTRIQVDTPGRYRVFYRAIRRGVQSPALVGVDSVILDGRTLNAERRPYAATLQAGTLDLTRGIHTLTVRPLPGQDIRADFVVLSADPTVAGYGFGVLPDTRR